MLRESCLTDIGNQSGSNFPLTFFVFISPLFYPFFIRHFPRSVFKNAQVIIARISDTPRVNIAMKKIYAVHAKHDLAK